MKSTIDNIKPEQSLRARIRTYQKRIREIETYLEVHPHEWGRFQSEFNQEINGIFREIMLFEKENLASGRETNVYKLKNLFVRKLRKHFLHGDYITWSLKKPFGYAGDYKIIDDIYRNQPRTQGVGRLFDNYFQMSAISVAVRNRKEDFKRLTHDFISDRKSGEIKVLDLACGPCRDIKELFLLNHLPVLRVKFDCLDNDQRAIDFAKTVVGQDFPINFHKENVVKLALKKDIEKTMDRYDLIFATGLFDYFSERVSVKLIGNLRKILKPMGVLVVSCVREKFSNPSVHFMEWVGEWNLLYRADDEFQRFFLHAGFNKNELRVEYEQQGIMQYVIARKVST